MADEVKNVRDLLLQPFYRIFINDSEMPSWMYDMVTKVCFKETNGEGANESFDIYFDDPEFQVMNSNTFIENKTVIEGEMGYLKADGNHSFSVMFYGIVKSIENDYPQSGKVTLRITARDTGYTMSESEKSKVWKGKTYSDIVQSICAKNGIIAIVDDTNKILPRSSVKHEKTKTYKVKKGDTLQKISKKMYGSNKYWKKIKNANKKLLNGKNSVKKGQILSIPALMKGKTKKGWKVETLAIVNQSNVSDLKFMQNMAKKCNYKLKMLSYERKCYFVKPNSKKLKNGGKAIVDYKEGNEALKSFRPKYNDYKKSMEIRAANINIEENKVVTSKSNSKSSNKVKLPTTHKVKSGETLAKLSKKYYGSDKYWKTIYNANKKLIKNKSKVIKKGQVITIPKLKTNKK